MAVSYLMGLRRKTNFISFYLQEEHQRALQLFTEMADDDIKSTAGLVFLKI